MTTLDWLTILLSCSAKIDWLCHDDPNNQHMVMLCAPDKVPDYSRRFHNIRIYHMGEVLIEKSVPRVTVWHHEALLSNAKL